MKKIIIFLLTFIFLCPFAQAQQVQIITHNAYIYKTASTGSEILFHPEYDELITFGVSKGNWAYVKYNGKTGYILTQNISKNITTSKSNSIICYLKESAELLNASGEIITTLHKGDKVLVSQVIDGTATIYTTSKVQGYLPSSILSKTKVSNKTVVLKDWFKDDIQSIFSVGTKATIVDVDSGKYFNISRKGGLNHADVETITAEDTKTLLKIYNGKQSWERKAIWVVIDGVYYAGSMNGMAHGDGNISGNKLDGHICIHFYNSKTHESNNVDKEHQSAIKKAYTTQP